MKKTILSIVALMSSLGMSAQTTTTIDVIRIYSSERTGTEASYPVAEYQNSSTDKYSAELKNGEINIYKSGFEDAIITWSNSSEVKYRVELQRIKVATDGESNGNQYVNLGLTSGSLWAKTNVGATNEIGYGGYYPWGETTACNEVPDAYPTSTSMDWTGVISSGYKELVDGGTIKETCLYRNYKWCSTPKNENNPKTNELSKYITDAYKTLETADDAATANWGSTWSMPTKVQMVELVSGTNCYWLNLNGVNGYRFVKKDDTSRYIFLPAGSMAAQTGIDTDYKGTYGFYWSKDRYDTQYAYTLYFSPSSVDGAETDIRPQGFSIRPVITQ